MSETVITVENLSKRYLIRHARGQMGDRDGLRHRIEDSVRAPWRWLSSQFAGKNGDRNRSQSALLSPTKEEFWALKDVSFEVKQGEVLGIIGRNGAGKSTLLKILSRITEPTKGRIEITGRVASLLEVGTGFHQELTGRENIFLNGAILGMTRVEIKRKFDEIVAFSEIDKFLDTPVKRYSSGMYVRLAFAVAAHLEPEILIVDEVLAVGDAQFQKKCLGKMQDASKGGRTILFVSHNMAALTQLCSRALWLKNGECVLAGLAAEIVQKYLLADAISVWERSWRWPGDAPGDYRVRLLGVRVLQQGRTTGVVDINESFELEIRFAVLRHSRNLITGFNFCNSQGICLFASSDWKPNSLEPGVYSKKLQIPPRVFAEDRVSLLVQLVFYEPDIPSVVIPDAITFETMDSAHTESVRGYYRGLWPGLLRLGLQWQPAEPTP